jgi:hypothetical protein
MAHKTTHHPQDSYSLQEHQQEYIFWSGRLGSMVEHLPSKYKHLHPLKKKKK